MQAYVVYLTILALGIAIVYSKIRLFIMNLIGHVTFSSCIVLCCDFSKLCWQWWIKTCSSVLIKVMPKLFCPSPVPNCTVTDLYACGLGCYLPISQKTPPITTTPLIIAYSFSAHFWQLYITAEEHWPFFYCSEGVREWGKDGGFIP